MRSGIVMGGCYLGMAGHDVFNNKVREIVNTNEHRVVLLALDISNFKYINDFYGMDEGDKVMQDIADFYFINEPLCLASHGIGFDQFRGAYKVDNMTNEDVVEYIARKNRIFEKELSERYPLVYQHVYVGLYFYDDPSLDVRMAVDRANLAKKSTKGRFDIPCCVYSADNCNEYLEHMDMSNEFVRACEEERIEIFLQTKISVSHNCVAGAEALVRMKTRAGELVSPARFVPVLEHTGMIGKLDDIMLDKTFAFQRQCIDKGIKPVPVSVNISRQRFTSEDLLKYMLQLQDKYQIDSALIELENPYNFTKPLADKSGFDTYYNPNDLWFIAQGANSPVNIFRRGGITTMTGNDVETGTVKTRFDMELGADVVKGREFEIGLLTKQG